MQDFSEFRPSKLWKKLSAERRIAAAELFWADEQSTEQQIEAVGALAAHMKFRPKSVIGLPLDKKVKYLATLPTVSDAVAALRAWADLDRFEVPLVPLDREEGWAAVGVMEPADRAFDVRIKKAEQLVPHHQRCDQA